MPAHVRRSARDAIGSAYVVGSTGSGDFPTVSPLQTWRGEVDAFVTRIGPAGGAPLFSTYLGGSTADFPVVAPFQPSRHGVGDAYVSRVWVGSNSPSSKRSGTAPPADGLDPR